LLLEETTWDQRYHTPQRTAGELYAALTAELAGPGQPVLDETTMPTEALIAAQRINDHMLTLLRLLGPDAVTIDPLPPLRLRDHAPLLPGGHRLTAALAEATRQFHTSADARFGGQRGHAGTIEFARTGTPTNLLTTQLALPPEIFTARHLSNELIYRLHHGPTQPRLTPTTIILDTTPRPSARSRPYYASPPTYSPQLCTATGKTSAW
jgi:hypothetical protein